MSSAKTGHLENRYLQTGRPELTTEGSASQERGAFEVILERIDSDDDDKLLCPMEKLGFAREEMQYDGLSVRLY